MSFRAALLGLLAFMAVIGPMMHVASADVPITAYSTFLGPSADWPLAVAVDTTGNAYITGGYFTDPTGFTGFVTSVMKVNALATAIVSAAESVALDNFNLGWDGYSSGEAIALDSVGNVYIAGTGALQAVSRGFIMKLNTDGSIAYVTQVPGVSQFYPAGLSVSPTGEVYAAGGASADFVTTPGALQGVAPGLAPAFVMKLDAAGNPVYKTFLGGSFAELATGIATDGQGNAYVSGKTRSEDFPTTPGAFRRVKPTGTETAFLAKLNASGSGLVYATYFPTDGDDAEGLVVDGTGAVYVVGLTGPDFPVTAGAYQTQLPIGVGTAAIVAKFDAQGQLDAATFLKGESGARGQRIGLASDGVIITGKTSPPTFPTTDGTSVGSSNTTFIAKFSRDLSGLTYSTALPHSLYTEIYGVAVDAAGALYAVGTTDKSEEFVTTPGVAYATSTTMHEGFAMKIVSASVTSSDGGPSAVTVTLSATAPGIPTGFTLDGAIYDIASLAPLAGTLRVCLPYSVTSSTTNLVLLHAVDGLWEEPRNQVVDTAKHQVCADVDSLSPFAVARRTAYNYAGFFSPVENLPSLNAVKAGSAVPVKFSLGGNQGLNVFTTGSPTSGPTTCDSTADVVAIEETVTAGSSSLSYDASTDRYIYVWKTEKAWAGTCRQLVVKLTDGTFHRANFKLLK
jgi:hypothetical protein